MTDTETGAPAAPMGRRERKKAATRQAIATAALHLFLERGYDAVGIREIADAADVSTTTLFKHFPVKEALVFDEDADQEALLLSAVRDRPPGQSIPAALCAHALRYRVSAGDTDERFASFVNLVESTPALRDYGQRMWLRHETALAQAIAADIHRPSGDPDCIALAHFALEAPQAARAQPDTREAVARAFRILEHGWADIRTTDRDSSRT